MNRTSTPTAAFDVETMRRRLLAQVQIPQDMVNDALRTTHAKLQAKTTKFFSYKGKVVDEVDVEDHATQLAAADQIHSIAGLYARERDAKPAPPAVTVEWRDGVLRLIVGGSDGPEALPESEVPHVTRAIASGDTVECGTHDTLAPGQLDLFESPLAQQGEEPRVQVVKVRRTRDTEGNLDDTIRKILFGENGHQ